MRVELVKLGKRIPADSETVTIRSGRGDHTDTEKAAWVAHAQGQVVQHRHISGLARGEGGHRIPVLQIGAGFDDVAEVSAGGRRVKAMLDSER